MKLYAKQRLLSINLEDEELEPEATMLIPSISDEAKARAYDQVGTKGKWVFLLKKDRHALLAVQRSSDPAHTSSPWLTLGRMSLRKDPYPTTPKTTLPLVQVAFVTVLPEHAQEGLAKAMYHCLLEQYTLVSDHVHYIGGKRLWHSLAKDPRVYIYIWDGSIEQYRTVDGVPVRYQNNVPESSIWDGKATTLLVASYREVSK